MFIFDVETLGKESNSVILSMAACYFDPTKDINHSVMREDAFFVKFDVADQMKRLNRKMGKTTLGWWAKQCENVRIKSFKPNPDIDVKFEDGYEAMRKWAKHFNDDKCWVFARGNLDQLVLDSCEEHLEIEPVFYYNRWRDVRTFIDLMYGSTTGYCDVAYPGFEPELHVTKHDPIQDCAYDVMMMLHGKEKV